MNSCKFSLKYMLLLLWSMFFYSCKKDNYAPPNLTFSGRATYNGTPIGLKNNNGGSVYFELWQPGFGSSGPINVYFDQDGSFSSLLFSGNYKMVIPASQGPFMSIKNQETNSDTTLVTLTANKTIDIEVLPYYMISKETFKLNADSTVNASCAVTQIITDNNARKIDYIGLFVNRTSFVDDDNNVAKNTIDGSALNDLSNISFKAKIPANISNGNIGVPTQKYFFVRIGLKISGRDGMLFSSIQKISF